MRKYAVYAACMLIAVVAVQTSAYDCLDYGESLRLVASIYDSGPCNRDIHGFVDLVPGNGRIYAVTYNGSLHSIDITEPDAPNYVGHAATLAGEANGVADVAKGRHPAGSVTLYWNGRDDRGRDKQNQSASNPVTRSSSG